MNASNFVIGHADRTELVLRRGDQPAALIKEDNTGWGELFYDWSSGAELEQFEYSALMGWAAFKVGGSVVLARDQSAALINKA